MVNLFKRNATIGVINTPECGTHNMTFIGTHNSQRTEHKYIYTYALSIYFERKCYVLASQLEPLHSMLQGFLCPKIKIVST